MIVKRWRLVGLSVLIVAAGVGAVGPSAAEGPGAPDAAGRLNEDTAGAALDAMREHAVPAPRDGTPAPAALTELVRRTVAVTQPDGPGFVTLYPCGTRREVASLNYEAGQTVPNAVIAPVSANGTVCFYSLVPTHIVADINGWFATA